MKLGLIVVMTGAWLVSAATMWAQPASGGSSSPPSLPPLPEPNRPKTDTPKPSVLPPPETSFVPQGPVRLRTQEKSEPRRGGFNLADSTVITSDDLVMDMERKIATFTGHVKVVDPQGTMTADKMIVYLAQEGENQNGVKRIESTGGVLISQQGSKAMADEAIYNAAEQTVILSGAASVDTADGTVTGETVVYDMAKGSAQVKGRPRMVILPRAGSGSDGNRPALFPMSKSQLPSSKQQ